MSVAAKKISIAFSLLIALVLGLSAVYSATVYEAQGTTSASSSDVLSVKVRELTYTGDATDIASDLLVPGESVSISPCVENTSDIDGWVYLVVDTPKSVDGDAAYVFNKESNWKLIEQYQENGRCKSVYGFEKIVPAKNSSDILFNDLIYKEIVLDPSNTQIAFTACAIQAAHVDNVDDGWVFFKKKHLG